MSESSNLIHLKEMIKNTGELCLTITPRFASTAAVGLKAEPEVNCIPAQDKGCLLSRSPGRCCWKEAGCPTPPSITRSDIVPFGRKCCEKCPCQSKCPHPPPPHLWTCSFASNNESLWLNRKTVSHSMILPQWGAFGHRPWLMTLWNQQQHRSPAGAAAHLCLTRKSAPVQQDSYWSLGRKPKAQRFDVFCL